MGALKLSYSDVGEKGERVAVNCKKTTFFPEQPVYLSFSNWTNEEKWVNAFSNDRMPNIIEIMTISRPWNVNGYKYAP